MKHLKTRDIKKFLENKYQLKTGDIDDITLSVFEFVRMKASEGDRVNTVFDNIRVPGLGVFYVKEGTKKRIKTVNDKRKELSDESVRDEE